LLSNKFGIEKVDTYQQNSDLGSGKGFDNLIRPFLTWNYIFVAPNIKPFIFERFKLLSQHCEPPLICVAIADKHTISHHRTTLVDILLLLSALSWSLLAPNFWGEALELPGDRCG
jgi:hypothetical protein